MKNRLFLGYQTITPIRKNPQKHPILGVFDPFLLKKWLKLLILLK